MTESHARWIWLALAGATLLFDTGCASTEPLDGDALEGGSAGAPNAMASAATPGAAGETHVTVPDDEGHIGMGDPLPVDDPGDMGSGGIPGDPYGEDPSVDPVDDLGQGGAAPSPPDETAEPTPEECVRDGARASEVVMIGDSFYHITEIPQRLWENARAAGSLGSLETYRNYYLSGAMMSAPGLATPITVQYDEARAADPTIVDIVMNGGGNDVLIRDRSCLTVAPPENAQCAQTIDGVVADARALFARMGADGVQRVVFAFYPHMPTFGLFQGVAPAINDTIDYAQERARAACEESVLPECVFVSMREAFEGHPEYLNLGDVHASPAGSQVGADLIWEAMVDHCIAQ